jgi:hypothetical protein
VFENRVLKKIFEPKRDEVIGGWRKLHNEEICHLYSSPSVLTMIKSRRVRWTVHVARMGRIGTCIDCLTESQREGDYQEGWKARKDGSCKYRIEFVNWIDLAQDRD